MDGILCGPVLKLVTFSMPLRPSPWLCRRWGAGLFPTGHTSATTTSRSLITSTSLLGGTGSPVVVKNVSKYSTKACTFVRRSDVEVSENGDAKSNCFAVIVPICRSCMMVYVRTVTGCSMSIAYFDNIWLANHRFGPNDVNDGLVIDSCAHRR